MQTHDFDAAETKDCRVIARTDDPVPDAVTGPVIDPALQELLRPCPTVESIARVMADRQPVLVQPEDYLKVCDRRTAQSQPPGHQPSGRARRFHSSTLVPLLPNRA